MAKITIDTSEWVRSIGIVARNGWVETNREYGAFWAGNASARIECDELRDPIVIASRLTEPGVCRMIDELESLLLRQERTDGSSACYSYTDDGVRMLRDIADTVCPGSRVRCYNRDNSIVVDLTDVKILEPRIGHPYDYVVRPEDEERHRLLSRNPATYDWCYLPTDSYIRLPNDIDAVAVADALSQATSRVVYANGHTLTVSGTHCND